MFRLSHISYQCCIYVCKDGKEQNKKRNPSHFWLNKNNILALRASNYLDIFNQEDVLETIPLSRVTSEYLMKREKSKSLIVKSINTKGAKFSTTSERLYCVLLLSLKT